MKGQENTGVSCDTLALDSLETTLEKLYLEGEYNEAIDVASEMTRITEVCYGAESKQMVESLHNEAFLLLSMRQYDASSKIYKEAIDLARQKYPPSDETYMGFLKWYAKALRQNGQYLEALPVHKEIYQYTLEFDKDDPKLMATWSNTLGFVHKKLDNLKEAEKLYLNALSITEQAEGRDIPQYAIYQNNLAGLYRSLGRYEEALDLYKQALNNAEINFGRKSEKYTLRQRNLAGLLSSMGRYEKALPLMLENMELTEMVHGRESANFARILDALGLLYIRMGQNEKAIQLMLEGKTTTEITLGKDHPEYSSALNNLALAYARSGNFTEAEELYHEAARLLAKNMGKNNLQYAIHLDNIGQVYHKQGQYQKSIEITSEAINITREHVGKHHNGYAIQINNLALSYSDMGDYARAAPLFKQALEIQLDLFGENHPEIAVRLNNLGKLYERQAMFEEASAYYCDMIENIIGQLYNYYPAMGEMQRLNFLGELESYLNTMYSFAPKAAQNPRVAQTVQELSLNSKGLALEGSIDARIRTLEGNDTELHDLQREWNNSRLVLYKLYTLSNEQRNELGVDFDSVRSHISDLEGRISRKTGMSIRSEAIQYDTWKSHIPPGAVAVDFIRYEENDNINKLGTFRYAAVVTRPTDDYPMIIPLAREKEILTHLVSNPGNPSSFLHPVGADLLADKILMPIMPYVQDSESILIFPTGYLNKISFEMLPVPGSTRDLIIDRFNVQYFTNPRSIMKKEAESVVSDFLLVGGAQYDLDSISLEKLRLELNLERPENDLLAYLDRSELDDSTRAGLYFPYLPGTMSEVSDIADIIRKYDRNIYILTGQDALEDRIKEYTEDRAPGVMHLSTHGFFFESSELKIHGDNVRSRLLTSDNPLMRTGLVFSGVHHAWQGGEPIKGLDDGILTAYEIANLDLRNTDLVVLSACETGLGSIHQAEGVIGLQRAFQFAGADKLILSLWKVPDRETAKLMTLFYKHYLQSDNAAESFRKARKKMRRQHDPYYWAGFIMIE